MTNDVLVVGSLNMDLVVQADRRPEKGETLRGTKFGMFAGGKGNNQAIAAARAGAHVAMIGRVGQDSFGDQLLAMLENNHVNVSGIVRDRDTATGIGHITVDKKGGNYIVIAEQANGNLCEDDIERSSELFKENSVLLIQLEVPFPPLIAAAKTAKRLGLRTILNPAPAPQAMHIPEALLANVDIIVPNQTESQQLTGFSCDTLAGSTDAAKFFQSMGIETTIVTLGERGALLLERNQAEHVNSFPVDAIDTTASGDAFCGAFAAALAGGSTTREAVRRGCAAGALACTKLGAEPSLPTKADIDSLVNLSAPRN